MLWNVGVKNIANFTGPGYNFHANVTSATTRSTMAKALAAGVNQAGYDGACQFPPFSCAAGKGPAFPDNASRV